METNPAHGNRRDILGLLLTAVGCTGTTVVFALNENVVLAVVAGFVGVLAAALAMRAWRGPVS